jgi:hypothetical protein
MDDSIDIGRTLGNAKGDWIMAIMAEEEKEREKKIIIQLVMLFC